jgi:eukaryotic-like serine/threonine-protein kinase
MRRAAALFLVAALGVNAQAAPARKADVDQVLHALQNPKNVGHAGIQGGRIEMQENGPFGAEPWMKSGGNVWFFKGYDAGGHAKGIRVYKQDDPGRETRYRILNDYLAKKKGLRIVPFEYRNEGLLVTHEDGTRQWEPAMFPDMAKGERIDRHVEALVEAGDSKAIGKLATGWRALMTKLRAAKVAHGDLQHGNIYVHDKGFELIDPDAMYVPGMENHWSGELGHKNFQHPKVIVGRKRVFGPDMDHFSSLVVYLSLRALEADPSLWQQRRTGDGLLLQDLDLHDPKGSAMIDALSKSASQEVRDLTAELVSVLGKSDADAKHLDDLLPAPVKKVRAPRAPKITIATAPEPAVAVEPPPVIVEQAPAPVAKKTRRRSAPKPKDPSPTQANAADELLQAIAADPPARKARTKKIDTKPKPAVKGAGEELLQEVAANPIPGKPYKRTAASVGQVTDPFADFAQK